MLAKKLFYRGWALTPRDLFDWHAIETKVPEAVGGVAFGDLLTDDRVTAIVNALTAAEQSAAAALQWSLILAPDKAPLAEVVHWARDRLTDYVASRSPRP